jgi:hypothetical protein
MDLSSYCTEYIHICFRLQESRCTGHHHEYGCTTGALPDFASGAVWLEVVFGGKAP